MAADFPDNPNVNDTFTVGDRSWIWNGTTWDAAVEEVLSADAPITFNSSTRTVGLDQAGVQDGRNYIINGAFDFWQRGDSIDVASIDYSTDRFQYVTNSNPTNVTIDKRDFTPDELNANGFGDAKSHLRINMTDVGSMTLMTIGTKIEDVQTLAGQTVTVSFWAKADSNRTLTTGILRQNFGSGGSSNVNTFLPNIDLTTSWQRFTSTVTLPSISGKTIGSGSYLQLRYNLPVATGAVIDLWGVQLEAGSIATPFKRNANSIAMEKLNCQRYYWKFIDPGTGGPAGFGFVRTSTTARITIPLPIQMRATPTVSGETDNDRLNYGTTQATGATYSTLGISGNGLMLEATISSTSVGQPVIADIPNLELDAEL